MAVKAGLEDHCVNHYALDIIVIKVQEQVKDLESWVKWINNLYNTHSASLDNFSICINNTKETLEEFEGNWRKYDQDQKWNILMAHLNCQCRYILQRKLDMVETKVSNIEETLMREIHCLQSLCGDGETIGNLPYDPSGWEPCYQSDYHLSEVDVEDCIREDEAEVLWRIWVFEEETKEVPIIIRSLASIISQENGLRLVSSLDLDSGESEIAGSPVSTLATSVPDKNIIPLPVVHGVICTSFNGRHHP